MTDNKGKTRQSSQDQRPDSRWDQMTTPTGHNRRDPGVPSTSEKRKGSGRREGEEESVGALVGKNQTGPNYRNHNESVSRGTLLPGKQRGICIHSQMHPSTFHIPTHIDTRALVRNIRKTSQVLKHFFFSSFHRFRKKHTDTHAQKHTREYACASNYAKNTHTVTSSKHSVDPNNQPGQAGVKLLFSSANSREDLKQTQKTRSTMKSGKGRQKKNGTSSLRLRRIKYSLKTIFGKLINYPSGSLWLGVMTLQHYKTSPL